MAFWRPPAYRLPSRVRGRDRDVASNASFASDCLEWRIISKCWLYVEESFLLQATSICIESCHEMVLLPLWCLLLSSCWLTVVQQTPSPVKMLLKLTWRWDSRIYSSIFLILNFLAGSELRMMCFYHFFYQFLCTWAPFVFVRAG